MGGIATDLGYGYAIVDIQGEKIIELARYKGIQYIEIPKSLALMDQGSNKASCVLEARQTYNVEGEGVVIGFIDSGIDYTHPAFRDENGDTRIEYIYDLSIGNGVVYDKKNINEALKEQDPFSVVPSYDETGHGTHVVGIACAGGKINKRYYGVAPKSSIMMVKSARGYFSLSTQIMRGLKFLVDKSNELNMPLVVNMSLSTNDGAHDGKSLLEQYINTIATHERISIVIAAGNEGDAAHHVGGNLERINSISFNVAEDETTVFLNVYKSILPKISIELEAPTAASTGPIVIEEGYREGVVSGNRYTIFTTGPKPFDMNGDILISIISEGNAIISGVWKIIIRVLDEYEGQYDMWLPISEGLSRNTKFLQPNINNTLGIPATVSSVISVGSYNYLTRNISAFSGRGRNYGYFSNKPEIVAPGEGIISVAPNNSTDTKTGTSMATPHVSGICALIMEWGIVKGNDIYLFGDRLKYFLTVTAKKERRDIQYPNNSWGYGEVCAMSAFEYISDVLGSISSTRGEYRQNINFKTVEEYINSFENSPEIIGSIIEYKDKNKVLQLNQMKDVSTIILNDSFAVLFARVNQLRDLLIEDNKISLYVDINPQLFTLNVESPAEASGALGFHENPYLTLNGKDVLIGIIDTGIDYLNEEFQKEDDTTRIVGMWDQTLEYNGNSVFGLKLGQEFTEEQINSAIKLSKEGGDPYSIVPSRDVNGHGTMLAGLAAARGRDPSLVGIAPDSKLAIVKLKQATEVIYASAGISKKGVEAFSSTNIVVAIRYLSLLASNLNLPLVGLLGLGSNTGQHKGLGILEGLINNISVQNGVVMVVGTGNQGDTDTHTEGRIEKTGDSVSIEVRIGKNQNTFNFGIWVESPSSVSISVISPSGEVTDVITPKSGGKSDIKFVYEETSMDINIIMPEIGAGDERIIIRSINIREGIWTFKLYGDYIVNGKYYAWMPQRELLDPDTKFLSPSQYTTLTSPSTADSAVSVAYYNQNNNAVVGASGRGYTADNRVKPNIAAGGIGAVVLKPGGGTGVASGSSVAASIVAGVCALILQWAIVNDNRPSIYSHEMISYIIRGARMRSGDSYPNKEWGYGVIDVVGIFDAIRGEYNKLISNNVLRQDKVFLIGEGNGYEEYYIGGLFIRKPIK